MGVDSELVQTIEHNKKRNTDGDSDWARHGDRYIQKDVDIDRNRGNEPKIKTGTNLEQRHKQ